jgi:multidrug efflux pump subunit AcrA (membrane-fusion protein)
VVTREEYERERREIEALRAEVSELEAEVSRLAREESGARAAYAGARSRAEEAVGRIGEVSGLLRSERARLAAYHRWLYYSRGLRRRREAAEYERLISETAERVARLERSLAWWEGRLRSLEEESRRRAEALTRATEERLAAERRLTGARERLGAALREFKEKVIVPVKRLVRVKIRIYNIERDVTPAGMFQGFFDVCALMDAEGRIDWGRDFTAEQIEQCKECFAAYWRGEPFEPKEYQTQLPDFYPPGRPLKGVPEIRTIRAKYVKPEGAYRRLVETASRATGKKDVVRLDIEDLVWGRSSRAPEEIPDVEEPLFEEAMKISEEKDMIEWLEEIDRPVTEVLLDPEFISWVGSTLENAHRRLVEEGVIEE